LKFSKRNIQNNVISSYTYMSYVASTITFRMSLGFVKQEDSMTVFASVNVSVREFFVVNGVLKFFDNSSCKSFVTLK